jgi:hypothetical protein
LIFSLSEHFRQPLEPEHHLLEPGQIPKPESELPIPETDLKVLEIELCPDHVVPGIRERRRSGSEKPPGRISISGRNFFQKKPIRRNQFSRIQGKSKQKQNLL